MSKLHDLREQALSRINRDIGAMVHNTPSVYTGNSTVPMSLLTQKKRKLEEQFNSSPSPYSQEATNVFNRTPQGFNQQQQNSLMDFLSSGQKGVGNKGWNLINKQFGNRTDNRKENYFKKFDKNLQKALPTSRAGIDLISNDARNLDADYNTGFGNSLNALGNTEKAKMAGLTEMLGQFGNQQHIYSHLANQVDKNKYYHQLNAPKQKLKALYNVVNNTANPVGPHGEASAIAQLEKGLQLYNSPSPSYTGQQLADVPGDLSTSHKLLEEFNPDYADTAKLERNNLYNSLTNRDTLSTRSVNNILSGENPLFAKLDDDTKRLLKAERARISREHERKGTYGSQSHLTQTEEALNRLARDRFENRNNTLQNELRTNLNNAYQGDLRDFDKLNHLTQQGLSEYRDVLGKIRSQNQTGVDKWLNLQDELNRKQQNFEEERNQEWPQGSGTDVARYNVSPEISSIFANPNVNNTPSVYSPFLRPNIHAMAQYAQTVPLSHSETVLAGNLSNDMGQIKNYTDFQNQQKALKEKARLQEIERQRQAKIAEQNRLKQQKPNEQEKWLKELSQKWEKAVAKPQQPYVDPRIQFIQSHLVKMPSGVHPVPTQGAWNASPVQTDWNGMQKYIDYSNALKKEGYTINYVPGQGGYWPVIKRR